MAQRHRDGRELDEPLALMRAFDLHGTTGKVVLLRSGFGLDGVWNGIAWLRRRRDAGKAGTDELASARRAQGRNASWSRQRLMASLSTAASLPLPETFGWISLSQSASESMLSARARNRTLRVSTTLKFARPPGWRESSAKSA